ncbi:cysteine hydrolase family protein [Kordiimonas pumila]|uniref:Cysteine hydrolase family protein n=1 Tax=Kordiimonas pumila TaxID=2161677 RepID=A0ABV7D847_9PROT|nr:isochorismatase family cysteine hydrolase [Kordiimonas pumila]
MDRNMLPDTKSWFELGEASRNSYRLSDHVVDMRRQEMAAKAVELKAQPQSLIVDMAKTALIIIDMQNDFCHPEGWIGGMGIDTAPARSLALPINAVTKSLRANNVPVIWVRWGVRPDKHNLSPSTQHPFNPNGMAPGLSGTLQSSVRTYNVLQKGSWGAEIIADLTQGLDDVYVDKHRISGFWDTPLDSILRNMGIKTVMFAGVNADHCVLGTLMDANFHGYDTILLEDCTATTSPDFCLQATYHNVRFCFGFTVTSSDVVKSLASA